MKTAEIRKAFLDHFASHGHAIVPSSPIIPQNDPTTLFTGSGMQPMVPYLLGQTHPMGTRITDSQICFRAEDMAEVGDNRHTTFFEMLGNWSLGDFFKEEQITMMWEFLVEKINLDPSRLYFTCFEGSPNIGIPRDEFSAGKWVELFESKGITAKAYDGDPTQIDATDALAQGYRVFYYPEKKNWWSRAGVPGNMPIGEPGGPDTEMFYDFDIDGSLNLHAQSQWAHEPCHLNCDCGRFVEIGNNVFMQYIRKESGFEELPQLNVDFGGGLERMAAASIDSPDVFMIDVFNSARTTLERLSGQVYGADQKATFAMRVIMDHLRGATFLIADGVVPAAKDQGYFTRRLIRRAVRFARDLGIHDNFCADVVSSYVDTYKAHYIHLETNRTKITEEVAREEARFRETLEKGLKIWDKVRQLASGHQESEYFKIVKNTDLDGGDYKEDIHMNADFIVDLYTTYGFPIEMLSEDMMMWRGKDGARMFLNHDSVDELLKKHQELSRAGSEQKFKGGLADQSENTVRLHTAHHLLLAALRRGTG
jgi:alanyl-tRNA synthetase